MATPHHTRRNHMFVSLLVLLGLLVASLPLGMGSLKPAGAESAQQTLTVSSDAGDPWADSGSSGSAVLTFGHDGCTALDTENFCTGGLWPTISGARWIWKSQLVTEDEAVNGSAMVTFTKSFTLPANATGISGQIQITADDEYQFALNGNTVASNGDLFSVGTYAINPVAGENVLSVSARNLPYPGAGGTPTNSPAGLIFRADITYQLAAPVITTIWISSSTPTQATIYFETDQPAQGYVDYGLTTNLGRIRPTSPPPDATKHSIVLSPLNPNTLYYYRARATNANGENTTKTYAFRTPASTATARLSVTKTNSDKTVILPGACFDLFRDAGNGALGKWVDGYCDKYDSAPNNGKVLFPALEPGSYVLVESRSPAGYALSPKRTYTLAAGQTLRTTVTDVRGGALVTIKKLSDDSNPLPGDCFTAFRMTNGVIGEYVAWGSDDYDGNDGSTTLGSLRAGTYWIEESCTPAGYIPADGQKLTIVSGQRTAAMTFTNYSETSGGTVELQAIDANGKLLPGACFVLFWSDKAREACDGWDGANDGRTFFANVVPASYTVLEHHAPAGYQVGKRTTFTKVDNTFKRLRFTQVAGGVRVSVKTLKGSTTSVLPGACYGLYKQVSSGPWPSVAFWCDRSDGSADGLTRLDGVKAGTYLLVQTVTPAGYAKPKDQLITVGTTSTSVTVRTYTGSTSAAAGTNRGLTPFIDPPVIESKPTPSPSATPSPTATATPAPTETVTPEPTATEVPNATPVADAGPDQTLVDTDGNGDEPVTLDATGSSDSEGGLTYSWSIGGTEIATGPTAAVALPVGISTVLLTVTDAQGAIATDEVMIQIDSQLPVETPVEPALNPDGSPPA